MTGCHEGHVTGLGKIYESCWRKPLVVTLESPSMRAHQVIVRTAFISSGRHEHVRGEFDNIQKCPDPVSRAKIRLELGKHWPNLATDCDIIW